MPRLARQKCESGIYHIMVRGVNRNDIFHDDQDHVRFLETLERAKTSGGCELLAYCLMSNHVHLLLRENGDDISKSMKRIGVSYAWWYNWKYEHVGHVFQDRYKSECIQADSQLLNVLRYIHNNPVTAYMVEEPEQYRWSSCKAYYGKKEYPAGLTDSELILEMLSKNKATAIKKLKEFSKKDSQDQFLEDELRVRKSDEELRTYIESMLNGEPITRLKEMEKKERDGILKAAKEVEGATQRQIARITGINQSTVSQA